MTSQPTIAEVVNAMKDYNAEMERILAECAAMRERSEAIGADVAKLKRSISAEKGRRTKANHRI